MSKKLSHKPILEFQKVYKEVHGKEISYEQAKYEGEVLMRLMLLVLTSDEARTKKKLVYKDNSN